MRDVIIIMQKQRALITCKNNLFKPAFDQNNSFLSVKFKVQRKRTASVCIRITFDEMESSFARFNDRRGLAVEVECDSAVSEGIHQILRL